MLPENNNVNQASEKPQVTLEELGQLVKSKYPGVYDEYEDSVLGAGYIQKYPVYLESLVPSEKTKFEALKKKSTSTENGLTDGSSDGQNGPYDNTEVEKFTSDDIPSINFSKLTQDQYDYLIENVGHDPKFAAMQTQKTIPLGHGIPDNQMFTVLNEEGERFKQNLESMKEYYAPENVKTRKEITGLGDKLHTRFMAEYENMIRSIPETEKFVKKMFDDAGQQKVMGQLQKNIDTGLAFEKIYGFVDKVEQDEFGGKMPNKQGVIEYLKYKVRADRIYQDAKPRIANELKNQGYDLPEHYFNQISDKIDLLEVNWKERQNNAIEQAGAIQKQYETQYKVEADAIYDQMKKVYDEAMAKIQNGESNIETEQQVLAGLDGQLAKLYSTVNSKLYKDVDALYKRTEEEYKQKMRDELDKSFAEVKADGSVALKDEYVKNYEDIVSKVYKAIEKERGDAIITEWNSLSVRDKLDRSFNVGMSFFEEGIGGVLKMAGEYEFGRMLTDAAERVKEEHQVPEFGSFEAKHLLDPDWWIVKGGGMMPMTMMMMLPSMPVTWLGGSLAAKIAINRGLNAAVTKGIGLAAGGILGGGASRFMESYLEAGTHYESRLKEGIPASDAAREASNIMKENMNLMWLDAVQLGLAFTPLKGLGLKACKYGFEVGSEGMEEVYQGWVENKQTMPGLGFWEYARTNEAAESFILGSANGLLFTVPDLISAYSNRKSRNKNKPILTDQHFQAMKFGELLLTGRDMGERKVHLSNQLSSFVAQGAMNQTDAQEAVNLLDNVYETLSAVPDGMSDEDKMMTLDIAHQINEIDKKITNSDNPVVKKFHEGQRKELMGQLDAIIKGEAPGYFINGVPVGKDVFNEFLDSEKFIEDAKKGKFNLKVKNDEEIESRLNDLFADEEKSETDMEVEKQQQSQENDTQSTKNNSDNLYEIDKQQEVDYLSDKLSNSQNKEDVEYFQNKLDQVNNDPVSFWQDKVDSLTGLKQIQTIRHGEKFGEKFDESINRAKSNLEFAKQLDTTSQQEKQNVKIEPEVKPEKPVEIKDEVKPGEIVKVDLNDLLTKKGSELNKYWYDDFERTENEIIPLNAKLNKLKEQADKLKGKKDKESKEKLKVLNNEIADVDAEIGIKRIGNETNHSQKSDEIFNLITEKYKDEFGKDVAAEIAGEFFTEVFTDGQESSWNRTTKDVLDEIVEAHRQNVIENSNKSTKDGQEENKQNEDTTNGVGTTSEKTGDDTIPPGQSNSQSGNADTRDRGSEGGMGNAVSGNKGKDKDDTGVKKPDKTEKADKPKKIEKVVESIREEVEKPKHIVAHEKGIPKPKEHVKSGSYGLADDAQIFAVNLAVNRFEKGGKGFLLADGTGFGKTIQLLMIANEWSKKSDKPILIITENASVVENFKADAKKINVDPSKFEITTYSRLSTTDPNENWIKQEYGLILYDEAHNLKNVDSKKSVRASNFVADHRVFATATPMDTPTGAAYFVSQVIDMTEEQVYGRLGFTLKRVRNQFSNQIEIKVQVMQGVSPQQIRNNIAKLRDEIIEAGGMIRREYPFWGSVQEIGIELSEDQAENQSIIEDYWDSQIEEAKSVGARKKVMNLAGQKSGELSRFNEQTKSNIALGLVKEQLKQGKKVVVVAEGINLTEIKALNETVPGVLSLIEEGLQKEGIQIAKGFGSNKTKKINAIKDFQEGKFDVIIGTPQSLGTGINLDDQIGDAPRSMIVVTSNYSGNLFQQILGRVSRRQTKSPAEVFLIFNNGVSDGRRREIVHKKLGVLAAIQHAKADIDDLMDIQEIDELQETVIKTENIKGKFNIQISPHPSNSQKFLVSGDTFKIKDRLGRNGARGYWNGRIKAWEFYNNKLDEVKAIIGEINFGADNPNEVRNNVKPFFDYQEEIVFPVEKRVNEFGKESNTIGALDKISQEKATAGEWRSILVNNGVNNAEMYFNGLNEFFEANPNPTKSELKSFISGVEIKQIDHFSNQKAIRNFERAQSILSEHGLMLDFVDKKQKVCNIITEGGDPVDEALLTKDQETAVQEFKESLQNLPKWEDIAFKNIDDSFELIIKIPNENEFQIFGGVRETIDGNKILSVDKIQGNLKDQWYPFAVKRALWYAFENGYSGIMFPFDRKIESNLKKLSKKLNAEILINERKVDSRVGTGNQYGLVEISIPETIRAFKSGDRVYWAGKNTGPHLITNGDQIGKFGKESQIKLFMDERKVYPKYENYLYFAIPERLRVQMMPVQMMFNGDTDSFENFQGQLKFNFDENQTDANQGAETSFNKTGGENRFGKLDIVFRHGEKRYASVKGEQGEKYFVQPAHLKNWLKAKEITFDQFSKAAEKVILSNVTPPSWREKITKSEPIAKSDYREFIKYLVDRYGEKQFDTPLFDKAYNQIISDKQERMPNELVWDIYALLPEMGPSAKQMALTEEFLHNSELKIFQDNNELSKTIKQVKDKLAKMKAKYGILSEPLTVKFSKEKYDLTKTPSQEFIERNYVNVLGRKVNTYADVADLFTIFRSPNMEKSHAVFVKNGEIVYHSMISSGSPDVVRTMTPARIYNMAKRLGCDTVYTMHNHPQSKPNPSNADKNCVKSVRDYFITRNESQKQKGEPAIEYKGEVIMNDVEFAVVAPKPFRDDLDVSIQSYITNPVSHEAGHIDFSKFKQYGFKNTASMLAFVGKQVLDKSNYSAYLFLAGLSGHIKGAVPIPDALIDGTTPKQFRDWMRTTRKAFFASYSIIVHDSPRLSYLPDSPELEKRNQFWSDYASVVLDLNKMEVQKYHFKDRIIKLTKNGKYAFLLRNNETFSDLDDLFDNLEKGEGDTPLLTKDEVEHLLYVIRKNMDVYDQNQLFGFIEKYSRIPNLTRDDFNCLYEFVQQQLIIDQLDYENELGDLTEEEYLKQKKDKARARYQITKDKKEAKFVLRELIFDRRVFLSIQSFRLNSLVRALNESLTKTEREIIPFLLENTDIPVQINRPDLVEYFNNTDLSHLTGWVNKIKTHFDEMWDLIIKNTPNLSTEQIEDYVTHIWDIPKNKKKDVINWFVTRNKFLNKRFVATLGEGITLFNLQPKVLDIADIVKIHGVMSNHVIANNRFIKLAKKLAYVNFDLDPVPLIGYGDKVPVTYKTINHPAFVALVQLKNGQRVKIPYRVHPDIHHEMNVILGGRMTIPVHNKDLMKSYEIVNGFIKKSILSLSFFHHIALTETGIALAPKTTMKLFKDLFLNFLKGGPPPAWWNTQITYEALGDGLQLGASHDYPAQRIQQVLDNLSKWSETISGLNFATSALSTFNKTWDSVLWDYLHDGLKLFTYWSLKSNPPKNVTDMIKYGRMVARFVNDTFGGQHFDLLNMTPKMIQMGQASLLSLDWTLSTTRQGLSVFGVGEFYDEMVPYRKKLGYGFFVRAFLIYGLIMNLLNAVFRYRDIKDHPELYPDINQDDSTWEKIYDLTMFNNSLGHGTHVFWGRYADGSERYLRLGKQFRELPELFLDASGFSFPGPLIHKIGGKAAPVPNLIAKTFMEKTFSNYDEWDLKDKQAWEWTLSWLLMLAKTPIPLSLQNLLRDDKELYLTDFIFPASKGMTPYQAKRLFKEAVVAHDSNMVTEIFYNAIRNDLNPLVLYNMAFSEYQSEQNYELKKLYKDQDDLMESFNKADTPTEMGAIMDLIDQNREKIKVREQHEFYLNKIQNDLDKHYMKLKLLSGDKLKNDEVFPKQE